MTCGWGARRSDSRDRPPDGVVDHGVSFTQVSSLPVAIRVTPSQGNSEQLVEGTGARAGGAYVAWQTPAASQGCATYLRPFSIARGWLTPFPLQVSTRYGDPSIWPGDTFGIATRDGGGDGAVAAPDPLSDGAGQPPAGAGGIATAPTQQPAGARPLHHR
jgi:hypothetical protein